MDNKYEKHFLKDIHSIVSKINTYLIQPENLSFVTGIYIPEFKINVIINKLSLVVLSSLTSNHFVYIFIIYHVESF